MSARCRRAPRAGGAGRAARSGVSRPARLPAGRLRERAPTALIISCPWLFSALRTALLGGERAACGREAERAGCRSWPCGSSDAGPCGSSRPAGSALCTGRAEPSGPCFSSVMLCVTLLIREEPTLTDALSLPLFKVFSYRCGEPGRPWHPPLASPAIHEADQVYIPAGLVLLSVLVAVGCLQ